MTTPIKASYFLYQTSRNLTDEDAGIRLRGFDSSVPVIDQRCPWTPEPVCTEIHRRFRTFDGSCNNLKVPNFGRAGTPLQRILEPSYGGLKTSSVSLGFL